MKKQPSLPKDLELDPSEYGIVVRSSMQDDDDRSYVELNIRLAEDSPNTIGVVTKSDLRKIIRNLEAVWKAMT